MIFVMQAADAKQKIECSGSNINGVKLWRDVSNPNWYWPKTDYRIKLPDGYEYTGEWREQEVGEFFLDNDYVIHHCTEVNIPSGKYFIVRLTKAVEGLPADDEIDVAYFQKELKSLIKSIPNRTPNELFNYFTTLANIVRPTKADEPIELDAEEIDAIFKDASDKPEKPDLMKMLDNVFSHDVGLVKINNILLNELLKEIIKKLPE